jgi:hypothetical protein
MRLSTPHKGHHKIGGRILAPILCSTVILALGCSFQAPGANGTTNSPRVVGGPCEYKDYRGKAEIVSMQKLEEGTGHLKEVQSTELYKIMYRFTPEIKIHEPFDQMESRDFVLLMDDSTYPDLEFINKNKIDVGKRYDCLLKVITKGACTPLIFRFPTLQ